MSRTKVWWANRSNLIHEVKGDYGYATRIYARYLDRNWEYAVVELRCGTVYLFGLYRDGSNCTPIAASMEDPKRE